MIESKIEHILSSFNNKPYLVDMGKGSLSSILKCTTDEIKAARKLYRAKMKHRHSVQANVHAVKNLPKILILDIETAPLKAYVWQLWKQNVYLDQIISNWFMLTWSAKWLGDSKIYSDKISKEEVLNEDDKRITQSLWNMLDVADIVITHNGEKFDLPRIRSRFLINELLPVTSYRSIDTLKVAKREFGFSSNKLEGIAGELGIKGKNETSMTLWVECVNGNEESIEYMKTYNEQDVFLLEEVYLKFRPHIKNHPNVTLDLNLDKPACTTCGSVNIYPDGEYSTQVNTYSTFRCRDCGSIAGRSRKSELTIKDRKHILMPVAK